MFFNQFSTKLFFNMQTAKDEIATNQKRRVGKPKKELLGALLKIKF